MKKHSKITDILSFVVLIFLVVLTVVGCKKECKHEYAENVVNPTCTAEGYTDHTCTKCANTYRDANTAATGHNYVEEVVAPTCSSEGYTKHTCLNCSDSYNDNSVPVTSHRFNGADCIYCSFKHPEEAITPDVEWYSQDKAVFNIETKEQLAGLASLVNEGTSFANTVIYLDADIDLAYAPWTPIGNADFAFDGFFVGNEHKICNLNISIADSYAGLFGNVTGELSDFTVDNASVFVSGANNYVGIVCGYTINKITGVKVDGYVDAKDSSNVGGIVGLITNIAGLTTGEITFCESITDVHGLDNVGGIVGCSNVSTSVFKGLVNHGNVKGSHYSGGIFGTLDGGNNVIYIDNSQNYGDVSGLSYVGGLAGRVVGKVSSIIQSSTSSASISGEYYVGGLVGEAVNVTISNCSNEGTKLSASSCVLVGDVYYAYVGGYVGSGYSVEYCINASDIEYLARGIYVGGIAGYLSDGVTECSNSGNITGYDHVGGIAGGVATPNAASVINLSNTGNITGKSRVGGIAGQWTYANPITLGEITNSGDVNGTSFVGGIIGYFNYSKEAVLSAYNLTNTGDIAGTESHIGGLFGYVNGKDSSIISNCTVKANISGLYLVGGLIGKAEYVKLSDSTNEGSTVTATGFIIEGEETNVYLGGYVGLGYKVSGCTNTVNINYTSLGNYVGGIIGKATSELHSCTNNASITSTASKVGGIAGMLWSNKSSSYSNLTNKGVVNGKDYVGGISGYLYAEINTCSNHSSTFSEMSNSGNIVGSYRVGGIYGMCHVENYHYCYNCWGRASHAAASHIVNTAEIKGDTDVGEIFGYFVSDGSSTLDNYTVTGKITVNNEVLEGPYDVGSSTNLTLTNRVCSEVEEAPETEETPAE